MLFILCIPSRRISFWIFNVSWKKWCIFRTLWFTMLSSNIIYICPSFLSTFNTIFRKLTTEITRHKYLTFLGTKCLIKIMTKYLFYFLKDSWKQPGHSLYSSYFEFTFWLSFSFSHFFMSKFSVYFLCRMKCSF